MPRPRKAELQDANRKKSKERLGVRVLRIVVCESLSIIFRDGNELTVALVRVPDLRVEDVPARARGKIEDNSARALPAPRSEMLHGPGAAYGVHVKERFELVTELSRRVFLHVPDIPDRARLPVRRGDDEHAAACKQALEFP